MAKINDLTQLDMIKELLPNLIHLFFFCRHQYTSAHSDTHHPAPCYVKYVCVVKFAAALSHSPPRKGRRFSHPPYPTTPATPVRQFLLMSLKLTTERLKDTIKME